MCRYAFYKYKSTYACFHCQVGFKRRNIEDVNPNATEGKTAKCPNCGNEMSNIGRDLRLPKKEQDEQWRCIKYLVDKNYNIYSCGCQGIGFVPHKMEDAIELVANVPKQQKQFSYEQGLAEKKEALAKKRKKSAEALKTKLLLRIVKKENQGKTPVLSLKNTISRLFGVNFEAFDYGKYHPKLPVSLIELYEIDAFYARHDCAFETIRFFCNQDRLVPYEELKLDEKDFVFVRENQNNWACKTQLGSNRVYFEDCVNTENSRFLPQKIDAFLATFALQEIAFNLPFYIGLHCEKVEDILPQFKKIEPLWSDKNYLNFGNFSYYLVDDDCLLIQAGMNILASKNEDKIEFYKNILEHYTF